MSCKQCVYPEVRCLNCGETPQWSSERPTEPGLYWLKQEPPRWDGALPSEPVVLYAAGNGTLEMSTLGVEGQQVPFDALWLRIEVPE